MNTTCLISLCLITKNEEHCLAACLASASPVVDEIILVDTGSEDNTLLIAAEYDARIYHFPWIDDFSAARNYAISQACGKWVLVLDADEKLTVTRSEILHFIALNPADGYYFNILSYIGRDRQVAQDQVVRLFKNEPQYRFTGAIHEQIAGSILSQQPPGSLLVTPFTIEHYGYLPEELINKSKFSRNTELLVKSLLNHPKDPFLHYALAIEYLQNRNFVQAEQTLQEALPLLTGTEGYLPQLLGALLLVKLTQPSDQQAQTLFINAIQVLPDNGDYYCLYGLWLMQRSRYSEAVSILEQTLQKTRELTASVSLPALLGDACCLAGQQQHAVDYFTTAVAEAPQLLYPWLRLLTMSCSENSPQLWDYVYNGLTAAMPLSSLLTLQPPIHFETASARMLLEAQYALRTNDARKLAAACSLLGQLPHAAYPVLIAPAEVPALVTLGTELLLFESQLILLGSNLAAQHSLEDSIFHQLRLLTAVISQSFPTNPLHFWEEVFIGEACFNRQPG